MDAEDMAMEHGVHKDLISKLPPAPKDPGYYCDWSAAPAQGTVGFNAVATATLQAGVRTKPRPVAENGQGGGRCPPLQLHQEVVGLLLHPQSPVVRLLVDHPTGSGKTREMISTLDNFFSDPRPKVPIFPKEPVCRNFYSELVRWPSRYRDFFACLRPRDAAHACGARDWRDRRDRLWSCAGLPDEELRDICNSMREALEMKGWFFMGRMRRSKRDAFLRRFPGEALPAAPLRAIRYTSAGGKYTELNPFTGLPASSLLKVAFDHQGKNVYSNKIVIMDEVHNLVRTQTQYGSQLQRLRELLHGARGLVLAGFTGTPILSEPWEGRQLLDIIKGAGAPPCDEGFLSSFPNRPRALFPQSLPEGVPDSMLVPSIRQQLLRYVTLGGEPLQKYDAKRQKGLPGHRLSAYCSMCVHFGSFHDGRKGSKARVLADMAACAPKLDLIAREVASCVEKQLVLVSRRSGMDALIAHLQEIGSMHQPPFSVATMDELSEFNGPGNLRGERFRVLVADATTCSEGVSFFSVRRVHLAEVPITPSAFVQSVGRAIRMYGHRGLPKEEQTVTTAVYVAGFPRWMRAPLGAWAFRAQKRHAEPREARSKARHLLRTLLSVGVLDLLDLKARIDSHGAKCSRGRDIGSKEPLEPSDICGFLEQLGLWDEAKALRQQTQSGNKSQARKKPKNEPEAVVSKLRSPPKASRPSVAASTPGATTFVKDELDMPASSRAGAAPVCKAEDVDDEESLSSLMALARAPGSRAAAYKLQSDALMADSGQPPPTPIAGPRPASAAPATPARPAAAEGPDLRAWARRRLPGALQALYLADSASHAIEELNLSPFTADEEAMKDLARKSREIMPALRDLRSKAVDRAILQVIKEEVKDEVKGEVKVEIKDESDAESSAPEFYVSGSDEEVKTEGTALPRSARPKVKPLVLPPGWRTITFKKGKRECREFLDPLGQRYRTFAQAQKAVDTARAMDNMTQKLKDKIASAPFKATTFPSKGA